MKITTQSWYSTRHNKRVHRIGIEGTSRNLMFNDDDLRDLAKYIDLVIGGRNDDDRTD